MRREFFVNEDQEAGASRTKPRRRTCARYSAARARRASAV